MSPIDIERMLQECVPGGSTCDPQQVADALRGWFAARSVVPTAVSAKPLDDPRLQQLFGDAIEGALAFGYQGENAPPPGHWLERFWRLGRAEANKTLPAAASQLSDQRIAELMRWEALAWHLCADENGEDACNELVWEGGPIPEPWGDRWLKYEREAKRMIELVGKYAGADQLRTAIAAERERVRLEHARELVEAHREAFVGNIEALSKLDLDTMNAQPLLMAVQNWDISTGRARELLRCWVLGTFKPDMLPECGDELFAEADEPRDAWAKLQAELSTLRQQLAEAGRDAKRYRRLVHDHPTHEARAKVYEVAQWLNVRGKGHLDAAIDAAIEARGDAK